MRSPADRIGWGGGLLLLTVAAGCARAAPPPPPMPEVTADLYAFEEAYRILLAGRLEEAVLALRDFERAFPNSPRLDRALFWKADGLGRLGEASLAARGYDDLVTRFPTSPYADDALYFHAALLVETDPATARSLLDRLIDRHPESPWRSHARAMRDRLPPGEESDPPN